MKTYFVDSNFYLRFILQDIKEQADKAESYLKQAKKEKIRITFLSEIILEMSIVLERYYALPKSMIAKQLLNLVKTPYVAVEDRILWLKVLEIFPRQNMDLLDIFLFEKAKQEGAEVLSFDRDFRKLRRRTSN